MQPPEQGPSDPHDSVSAEGELSRARFRKPADTPGHRGERVPEGIGPGAMGPEGTGPEGTGPEEPLVYRVRDVGGPRSSTGPGYKLYEPRPVALAIGLWVWLLLSAAYVVIEGIEAYLYFFAENTGPRFFFILVVVLPANLVRLILCAAALRSRQAELLVRVGWAVGIASGALHAFDYLTGVGLRFVGNEGGTLTPLPVAVLGAVAASMLLIPRSIRWVWISPEEFVPDWTYGGPKERPPGWKPPYRLDEEILRTLEEPQSTERPGGPSK